MREEEEASKDDFLFKTINVDIPIFRMSKNKKSKKYYMTNLFKG